jgi:hypothetical protein
MGSLEVLQGHVLLINLLMLQPFRLRRRLDTFSFPLVLNLFVHIITTTPSQQNGCGVF